MLYIYQPTLSDAQSDAVNDFGWAAADQYLKVTNMKPDATADSMKGHIAAAVFAGNYSHKWTVKTDDLEEAFDITNGFGDDTKIDFRARRPKSGSVGDIVMTFDASRVYICAPLGWIELPKEFGRWLQTMVSTSIKLTPIPA